MRNSNVKNYVYSTSIDTSENNHEFLIEVYSLSDEETDPKKPEKVIHDFDELITFFEYLDQESELADKNTSLMAQK